MSDHQKDKKTGLNPKQERFCQEYVIDYNGTQAVIRAGYSSKSSAARAQASTLLANPNIQARIKELSAPIVEKCRVDAEYVLQNLIRVGERCLNQREPEMVWDREERRMVPRTDADGNVVYRFDANGANRAFELIGRHVGMFDRKRDEPDTGNRDLKEQQAITEAMDALTSDTAGTY